MESLIFNLSLDVMSKLLLWVVAFVFAWLVSIINDKVKNDKVKFHLAEAVDVVNRAVVMTNQATVDELKKQGKFDPQQAKRALRSSFLDARNQMSPEVVKTITEAYGDLDRYIESEIERQVVKEKENRQRIEQKYEE